MRYEVTLTISVHPEADFAGTDDEIESIYTLLESAIADIEDFKLYELEVREDG